MITPKSKCGKAPQSLMTSPSDTLQLNGTLSLLDLPLDKVVKTYPYNSCKNVATLILLAQVAAGTDDNHHVKTKNAVSIDVTLIRESQSTNTMDGDSSSNRLSTPSL